MSSLTAGFQSDKIEDLTDQILDLVADELGETFELDGVADSVEGYVMILVDEIVHACALSITYCAGNTGGSVPSGGFDAAQQGVSSTSSLGIARKSDQNGPEDTDNYSGSGGDGQPGPGGGIPADGSVPHSYSCPYRKRNPLRFSAEAWNACASKGWRNFTLLK